MTETNSLDYFLFPHMTFSSNALENLCVFLPRLNILEIISRASIPKWAQERIYGHAILSEGELFSRIGGCIEGYRNFAKVHGGPGGVLGFLSHALDEIDEPRYRIQEELRGKFPPAKDSEEREIVQASVFLEMARELDEKELELKTGYDRMNTIEQEFRDILGIEDEESEQVETSLSSALAPDENGLLYMLAKRIESWFRMFSAGPVVNMPVFVAGFREVADETLDIVRTECERSGKDFSTAAYRLGPVPRLFGPAGGRLRTPLDAPGVSEVISSCRHGLDDFIRSAARDEEPEGKRGLLQSAFEELCRRCGTPQDARASLLITVVKNVSVAAIPGLPPLRLTGEAGDWPPVFLSVEAGRES